MENICKGFNFGDMYGRLDGAASASVKGSNTHSGRNGEPVSDYAAKWARKMMRFWMLALAKVNSEAGTSLHNEEWSQLWRLGQMPLSKKKTDMLVSIERSMRGLDEQTADRLPRGLSQLDREVLKKLINEEAVPPKLTLQGAKELLAKFTGRSNRNRLQNTGFQRLLRLLREYVEPTLSNWKSKERILAVDEPGQVIDFIATELPIASNGGPALAKTVICSPPKALPSTATLTSTTQTTL